MGTAQLDEPFVSTPAPWNGADIVALLASAAAMNGGSPALTEFSPEGETSLTAAEALEKAQALARQFVDLGLAPGRVVLVSLPNGLDAILSVLAVLMSGHSPCLLPVTASHEQVIAAMRATKPGAYVTAARVASLRPADVLRRAAAECGGSCLGLGFGEKLPAGVIALDLASVRSAGAGESSSARDLAVPPALLTADLRPEGAAVFRHEQAGLVATALHCVLCCGIVSGQSILSTISPMSHAGFVSGFVASLLVGGRLALQQAFSGENLLGQIEESDRPHLIAPGLLEPALATAGVLGSSLVSSTLLLHRPPVRFDRTEPAREAGSPVMDLLALAERSAVVARRGRDGRPSLRAGPVRIPDEGGALVLDWRVDAEGRMEGAGPSVADPVGEDAAQPSPVWRALGLRARLDRHGRVEAVSRGSS